MTTNLAPPDSSGKRAILTRDLNEIVPPRKERSKRKGTTQVVSFVLPHDYTIGAFYEINLREPLIVPAGATIALHVTMPKVRKR